MAQDQDTNTDMIYMRHLRAVALAGVALIVEKTRTYGPSWKRRGGPGAWFTTVRPWDRLETIVDWHGGDVFAAIAEDPTGGDGSALGCLRDIRNYTILIEAEMVAHGVVVDPLPDLVPGGGFTAGQCELPGEGCDMGAAVFSSDGEPFCFVDTDTVIGGSLGGAVARCDTIADALNAAGAQPTRDYVDQDRDRDPDKSRVPSSMVTAAAANKSVSQDFSMVTRDISSLGAGPVVNGQYTVLDLGHGTDLWHEGLGALPTGRMTHAGPAHFIADLHRILGAPLLIASRELEGGDRQIVIRFPGHREAG